MNVSIFLKLGEFHPLLGWLLVVSRASWRRRARRVATGYGVTQSKILIV